LVTHQNKLRVQYNDATGAINIWLNDVQIVSMTDTSPLPNGRYGFSALCCDTEFNNVTGSITDNFDSYSVGAVAEKSFVGSFEMWYLEGGTDTAGVRAGPATVSPATGAFVVTGRQPTLSPNSTHRITTTAGSFATTLNPPKPAHPKKISPARGSFAAATVPDSISRGYIFHVSAGVFSTSAHTSTGTAAVGPGRSRSATMAMFQALHAKTQGELRRKLATQPTDSPDLKTLESVKTAPKRGKRVPTKTVMPPKPAQLAKQSIAQPQPVNYTAQGQASPDDDAMTALLQHL
jgi:hypothetical protein